MRAIRSTFSLGERVSLIYMGFELASSPRLTWSKASSVGGSRCSKRMSHSMFRCLIQGSSSVFIISISSSCGSGWAETMLTETGSNSVPMLMSELKDEVSEEWSYLDNGLESTFDWSGMKLYPNPRWSLRPRELQTSKVPSVLCHSSVLPCLRNDTPIVPLCRQP